MVGIVRNLYDVCHPHAELLSNDDVLPVVANAVDIMGKLSSQRHICFEPEISDCGQYAQVVKTELLQAVCNLIQNALDGTPVDGKICLTVKTDNDLVVILVSD